MIIFQLEIKEMTTAVEVVVVTKAGKGVWFIFTTTTTTNGKSEESEKN